MLEIFWKIFLEPLLKYLTLYDLITRGPMSSIYVQKAFHHKPHVLGEVLRNFIVLSFHNFLEEPLHIFCCERRFQSYHFVKYTT